MSANSPGEKRRRAAKRERDRLAYEAAMAPLRAAGRSCASCNNFGTVHNPTRRYCELDSDYDGYAIRKPEDLCPRWAERRTH